MDCRLGRACRRRPGQEALLRRHHRLAAGIREPLAQHVCAFAAQLPAKGRHGRQEAPGVTAMPASQTAQVTLVIWTIWLTGGLLLAVLSLVPATSQKSRRLWTSYGGQGLVVLAATTPFLGGEHVLLACILAM